MYLWEVRSSSQLSFSISLRSFFKVLWTDNLCHNFELLVCLAILISQKTVIMESKFGCNEILKVCVHSSIIESHCFIFF